MNEYAHKQASKSGGAFRIRLNSGQWEFRHSKIIKHYLVCITGVLENNWSRGRSGGEFITLRVWYVSKSPRKFKRIQF